MTVAPQSWIVRSVIAFGGMVLFIIVLFCVCAICSKTLLCCYNLFPICIFFLPTRDSVSYVFTLVRAYILFVVYERISEVYSIVHC